MTHILDFVLVKETTLQKLALLPSPNYGVKPILLTPLDGIQPYVCISLALILEPTVKPQKPNVSKICSAKRYSTKMNGHHLSSTASLYLLRGCVTMHLKTVIRFYFQHMIQIKTNILDILWNIRTFLL